MAQTARSDAKVSSLAFTSDIAAKQQLASAAVRAAAEYHTRDIYRRLEVLRVGSQIVGEYFG